MLGAGAMHVSIAVRSAVEMRGARGAGAMRGMGAMCSVQVHCAMLGLQVHCAMFGLQIVMHVSIAVRSAVEMRAFAVLVA